MKEKRRVGFKYRLDVMNYPSNAANNFSFLKLIIFTCVSLILTIALLVNTINQGYTGKALVFTSLAFLLIFGYSILNIIALIIKIKNK